MARSTYFDLGRSADACPGSESGYAQRFQCGNIVKRRIWTRMIVITLALIGACLQVTAPAKAAQGEQGYAVPSINAVIEWNKTLLAIARTPGAQAATIHSTRNFAILHAAIYDAINNIDPKFSPYLVRLSNVPRSASETAAVDQVAHDVLVSLYPAFQASLYTQLQQ